MKLLNFSQEEPKKKHLSKKKIVIVCLIILFLLLLIASIFGYIYHNDFRNFVDVYILQKNVSVDNVPSIQINYEDNDHIFGYDKYIAVLNKNTLSAYSSSGKKEFELDIAIGNPISDSNNRFLALAESGGQKIYLISGQNLLWQTDVEGQISKISVNKNGYITVIISGTRYKTVIATYDPSGTLLFSTFLSYTSAADTDISNDNKYLAIAEVDTQGTLIQSNIKLISIEKAKTETDKNNAIEYIYPANSGELVTDIKYQENNKLVCMYDNSIHMIQDKTDTKILDISNKKDIVSDINLKNHTILITEKSSGLFADVELQITDINSQKVNTYTMTGVPKSVETKEQVIALNLGLEVHFVDCNGWVLKKYESNQEVKDIVLGSSIAGIIYKDKIELINL